MLHSLKQNRPRSRRAAGGFSLIEVLVAMTVFAFITAATGFALTTVLRTQSKMTDRAEMLQEIRGISAILRRDIRSAFVSANNPHTLFISGGSTQGALLTFSALTGRIEWSERRSDANEEEASLLPQSALRTIMYAHDPQTGLLTRVESKVPGTDATALAGSLAGLPETIMSRRVLNIAFEFFDAENQQVRQEWMYSNDPEVQQSGAQSDTSLPLSVHVELELADRDGIPERHTLVFALATPTPAPAGQAPPAATTGAGTTTRSWEGSSSEFRLRGSGAR